MIPFNTLLTKLCYDVSPHYYGMDGINKPEMVHLFRSALSAGVKGIYVFETSPKSLKRFFKPHPAVCVAEAQDETEAMLIHRKVWNLGYAPFLIIRLPKQIRVYTGFDYSEKEAGQGLIDKAENIRQLNRILSKLKADAIDSGLIWKSKYAKKLNPDKRVDKHLLKNLKRLGQALSEKSLLKDELIHALIGKFVYLSYLRDRKILTDEWMEKKRIDPESVFSQNATVSGLKNLVDALEERFNGRIFPIDFANEIALKDKYVQWVSAIFSGGDLTDPQNAPDIVIQLHLPFKAYDFEYIPVETLSAIYEQFVFDRKKKGAVYTPEILADYLISELEMYKELKRGMKILDPACGSGVFLVLVYRRLIEKEMIRIGRKLKPKELLDILQKSIFGVEREQDACYVAEFSLILTLLHYLESRDLKILKFHFPVLHNRQIFECDFFDTKGEEGGARFWQKKCKFDWIVGNPPWIELRPDTKREKFAKAWISDPKNKSLYPVAGNRVAEAFSWLITKLLKKHGIAGLILPATSLFNLESRGYRQAFFEKHDVLEITNFANIREKLFDRRSTLPAATFVYRKTTGNDSKPIIRHYAPFAVNQRPVQETKPWVITINENEIQSISPYEALKGETFLWKTALWANPYDRRIVERINEIFPISLKVLCKNQGWPFRQSAEFRNINEIPKDDVDKFEYVQEVDDRKKICTKLMNSSGFRFSIPDGVFEYMHQDM
ncbi:MAG TPA: N-6 DNA methylase, partial [Desulfobacterales bacterium]|nr:N-6 DNA methylase [Desulfobacterales bacterium]